MTKAQVAEAKSDLIIRLGTVCKMSREELLKELPQVCGFKAEEGATEAELIYVLMKFAILGVL